MTQTIPILLPNEHLHRCTGCGFIWKHDPFKTLGLDGPDLVQQVIKLVFGQDAYDQSHVCINCGITTFTIYRPQIDGFPEAPTKRAQPRKRRKPLTRRPARKRRCSKRTAGHSTD